MTYRNLLGAALGAALCLGGQASLAVPEPEANALESDASEVSVAALDAEGTEADLPTVDAIAPADNQRSAIPVDAASGSEPTLPSSDDPASESDGWDLSETASPGVRVEDIALTTVDELSDISPDDWAYQALQNLVETYGCLEGYPDSTFRGDRAVTRYEFAALLNRCLLVLQSVIESDPPSLSDNQLSIQRLRAMFEEVLDSVRNPLNVLEAETASLRANTFSTTTRLRGEVVFSLEQLAGGNQANGSGNDLPEALVFGSRARLNFNTSFTGRDLLRVRLDALDPIRLNAPVTGTNMTRLAFDRTNNNDLDIGKFFYRFPVSDRLTLQIDAARGAYQANVSSTFNPGLASPISGVVSRFGRFNPIYYQGALGTGITGVYDIAPNLVLSAGYLSRAPGSNNPNRGGLFGSGYSALVQLDYRPTETWRLGLVYARSYYPAGAVAVSAGTRAVDWRMRPLAAMWPPQPTTLASSPPYA